MFEITHSMQAPVSKETDLFNSNWKKVLFYFHKRVFLSKVEDILSAVAGHESNSLPAGNYQYQVLNARADSLCTEFADRWCLDEDLLRARIPGLAKLAGLSMPPPTKNYAQLAWLIIIATPLALFLLGVLAGLISVGFHFVGGR
jgi:hypothetical protein